MRFGGVCAIAKTVRGGRGDRGVARREKPTNCGRVIVLVGFVELY